jgi:hypothetical protein
MKAVADDTGFHFCKGSCNNNIRLSHLQQKIPVFIFAKENVTMISDLAMKAVTKDTVIHFCTVSVGCSKDIRFSAMEAVAKDIQFSNEA